MRIQPNKMLTYFNPQSSYAQCYPLLNGNIIYEHTVTKSHILLVVAGHHSASPRLHTIFETLSF